MLIYLRILLNITPSKQYHKSKCIKYFPLSNLTFPRGVSRSKGGFFNSMDYNRKITEYIVVNIGLTMIFILLTISMFIIILDSQNYSKFQKFSIF